MSGINEVDNIIQGILGKLVADYDPEKVILFGSHAHGSPTPGSDLDLLVITNTPLPPQNTGRVIYEKP